MKTIALALLLAVCSQAADLKHKILYATEAAGCLLQAADAYTSERAFALGAHESNPLLVQSGAGGKASWVKIIAYKSLLCGAPIGISLIAHKYIADRNADYAAFIASLGNIGVSSYAVGNNLRVIRAQRAINAALAAGK